MQEAFGGILNLVLIAVFLVIVESVLAFSVVYAKAFRMKNFVIQTIEEYEGAGCFKEGANTPCKDKITAKANSIGYHHDRPINCPTNYTNINNIYCYAVGDNRELSKSVSYLVVTQVDVSFPLIREIVGMSIFQVKGETRGIYIRG